MNEEHCESEGADGHAHRARAGIRVVVVEDDPDSREALCTLIDTLGFEVSSASDV